MRATVKAARPFAPPGATALLFAALCLAGAGSADGAGGIYFKVSNISQTTLAEVVDDLAGARVVVVGEQHGDAAHHRTQLDLIMGLRESGREVAVALEMFRTDAQAGLDAWGRGDLSEALFYDLYADNWHPGYWWIYRDIFLYARDHGIPLVGINVPTSIISRVAREGVDALSAEQRQDLPDIACEMSPEYLSLLRQVVGKGSLDDGAFRRFCSAQVLWDSVMARHVAAYLSANPRRVVVVMAGNFHAWKHGIPARLEAVSDAVVKVVLPSADRSFLRQDIFLREADYVWWDPGG